MTKTITENSTQKFEKIYKIASEKTYYPPPWVLLPLLENDLYDLLSIEICSFLYIKF
ncbi:MAG: hypothetical protein IJT36_06130 [Alphaproteobacteria bacterium]|nr:hypothetical protein [Alphaproteobacteria bacterium]